MGSARGIWPVSALSVAVIVALGLLGVTFALAQTPPPTGVTRTSPTEGVTVVTPPPRPPTPEFGFEESIPLEQGGIREELSYPERVRGVYAPAFLKGATKTVRTSKTSGLRWGLSGWTATRIPFDDQNASGGPALGLTFEFGVPLEPPADEGSPKR
jgi:hypothetical protein